MIYILMNFGAFIKSFAIYSLIFALIIFVIAHLLRKSNKHTNVHKNDTPDNQHIVHVKYECQVCGYISENKSDFDDGACIMCDAI